MLSGERYTRTMNAPSTEYFLDRIRADLGSDALALALSAVRSHLAYYEEKSGSRLPSIARLVDRFSELLAEPESYEAYVARLQAEVEEASQSAAEDRQARLGRASGVPRRISVRSQVFVRNPDVVAEVLARAQGVCERCGHAAPFFRARNGEPYLEVHHMHQLAHGGEDTVQNAVALCPNCHAECHYGQVRT